MRELKDYEKTIHLQAKKFKLAFKGKEGYGWDTWEIYEDLCQEGRIIFIALCKEEEKEEFSSSFQNVLITKIRQKWINDLRLAKMQKRDAKLDSIENHRFLSKDPRPTFDRFFSLSEELQIIVKIIADAPSELIELNKENTFYRAIRKYLHIHSGWGWKKINLFLPVLGKNVVN